MPAGRTVGAPADSDLAARVAAQAQQSDDDDE